MEVQSYWSCAQHLVIHSKVSITFTLSNIYNCVSIWPWQGWNHLQSATDDAVFIVFCTIHASCRIWPDRNKWQQSPKQTHPSWTVCGSTADDSRGCRSGRCIRLKCMPPPYQAHFDGIVAKNTCSPWTLLNYLPFNNLTFFHFWSFCLITDNVINWSIDVQKHQFSLPPQTCASSIYTLAVHCEA